MGYLKMMCSCLDLMKMAKLENDIPSRDVVVDSKKGLKAQGVKAAGKR
jgi:hypothetical protein